MALPSIRARRAGVLDPTSEPEGAVPARPMEAGGYQAATSGAADRSPRRSPAEAALYSSIVRNSRVKTLLSRQRDPSRQPSSAAVASRRSAELRDAVTAAALHESVRAAHRYAFPASAPSDPSPIGDGSRASQPQSPSPPPAAPAPRATLPTACHPPADIVLATQASAAAAGAGARPEQGSAPASSDADASGLLPALPVGPVVPLPSVHPALPPFGSVCQDEKDVGHEVALLHRGALPHMVEPLASMRRRGVMWSAMLRRRLNAIAAELCVPVACPRADLAAERRRRLLRAASALPAGSAAASAAAAAVAAAAAARSGGAGEEAWLGRNWRLARGGPGGDYVIHTEEELLDAVRDAARDAARDAGDHRAEAAPADGGGGGSGGAAAAATAATAPGAGRGSGLLTLRLGMVVPSREALAARWLPDLVVPSPEEVLLGSATPAAGPAATGAGAATALELDDLGSDPLSSALPTGSLQWQSRSVWHGSAVDVAGSGRMGTFKPRLHGARRDAADDHGGRQSRSRARAGTAASGPGSRPGPPSAAGRGGRAGAGGRLALASRLAAAAAAAAPSLSDALSLGEGLTPESLAGAPEIAGSLLRSSAGQACRAAAGPSGFGSDNPAVRAAAADGWRRGLTSRALASGAGSLGPVVAVLRRGSPPGHRAALWERVLGLDTGNDADDDDDDDDDEGDAYEGGGDGDDDRAGGDGYGAGRRAARGGDGDDGTGGSGGRWRRGPRGSAPAGGGRRLHTRFDGDVGVNGEQEYDDEEAATGAGRHDDDDDDDDDVGRSGGSRHRHPAGHSRMTSPDRQSRRGVDGLMGGGAGDGFESEQEPDDDADAADQRGAIRSGGRAGRGGSSVRRAAMQSRSGGYASPKVRAGAGGASSGRSRPGSATPSPRPSRGNAGDSGAGGSGGWLRPVHGTARPATAGPSSRHSSPRAGAGAGAEPGERSAADAASGTPFSAAAPRRRHARSKPTPSPEATAGGRRRLAPSPPPPPRGGCGTSA